jgi:ABC-2 type transport system permease protein
MNATALLVLVAKDIRLFFKNRFFAFVSVLGLVFYVAFFFIMPNQVDEVLELGWYGPALPAAFVNEMEQEGLVLTEYSSEQALRDAVLSGNQVVGVRPADDFMQTLVRGGRPQAGIYIRSDVPEEYQTIYTLMLEELSYMLTGQSLNIEFEQVILGPDMAGQQVPPRQRLLPLLATFLLMVETWGLAALISAEAERGTLRALLVTPLTVPGLFVSKGITGVLMSFAQVAILVALTGGLRNEPLLMVAAMLIGALLVTGISFLIASVSRDMMSVMAWGMLVMILLSLPGFNILLPGMASGWIKVIPSYYLVDTFYRVVNLGSGWSEMSGNLLALLASALVFFGLGVLALSRRLR